MILVLVAEGDEAAASRVEAALTAAGYGVVTAAGGAEALSLAREHRPTALVLDTDLPGVSGLEVCYQLRAELGTSFRCLLVSETRTDELDRRVGTLVGGDAYLPKPYEPEQLVALVTGLVAKPETVDPRPVLSQRELEILGLLAEGARRGTIAHELGISPKSVGSHLERITLKLGARTQAHAVATAVALGLLATG